MPNGMRRRKLEDREKRYSVENGAELSRLPKARQYHRHELMNRHYPDRRQELSACARVGLPYGHNLS